MSESLKQKLRELKRFRVLTNIESSISKGEKIVRKDYVETVKFSDVVALLDEAAKSPELLEKLAELEHEQWALWMSFLYSVSESGKTFVLQTKERWDKWQIKANTKYAELSEQDKESDRIFARGVLAVLGGADKK